MAGYWSGLVNSMKGLLGYEGLEVEPAGPDADSSSASISDEKKSLWKQLSNYIGKDVTSMISLPVWVFEPLSFLQIMCEPMQFGELLFKASEAADSAHRMAYLIAFITSGYSCAARSKKPFNPILGETFEYIPADKRWRYFAEQVTHHPPCGVAEVIADNLFRLKLEMELKTKFRGNSTEVTVNGSSFFNTFKYGDEFTWGHLDTAAHNIIIGGMWVDHYGTLEVKNRTNGDRGVIRYTKCGWLGAGRFELNGEIYDKDNKLRLKINGRWNELVNAIKITADGTEAAPVTLWQRATKSSDPKWNWTPFCYQMNECPEAYKKILPPNDSRLRGDRWGLEKEDLDTAGKEKHRLEEKQRAERKERETKGIHYVQKYFKKIPDDEWGFQWVYMGGYWEEREERIKKAIQDGQVKQEEIARYLLPESTLQDINKFSTYSLFRKYSEENKDNNNQTNTQLDQSPDKNLEEFAEEPSQT
jgi:anti-sigma28 factor (negative regulator of flagellin synthesis)